MMNAIYLYTKFLFYLLYILSSANLIIIVLILFFITKILILNIKRNVTAPKIYLSQSRGTYHSAEQFIEESIKGIFSLIIKPSTNKNS